MQMQSIWMYNWEVVLDQLGDIVNIVLYRH